MQGVKNRSASKHCSYETSKKDPNGLSGCRCDDNIKMHVKEMGFCVGEKLGLSH
jgi:hypothetical protein